MGAEAGLFSGERWSFPGQYYLLWGLLEEWASRGRVSSIVLGLVSRENPEEPRDEVGWQPVGEGKVRRNGLTSGK